MKARNLFLLIFFPYLTKSVVIFVRWRDHVCKQQIARQSKIVKIQVGKCQPILKESKNDECAR